MSRHRVALGKRQHGEAKRIQDGFQGKRSRGQVQLSFRGVGLHDGHFAGCLQDDQH